MGISQIYQGQGGALANYTFTELIEGTGIISFFGYSDNTAGTEKYDLSSSSPYSNLVSSSGALSLGGTFELDFDTPEFNLPRNLKGTAYVQIPWRVTNSSGSNNNFIYAKIFKWDGTTETLIAQTSGAIISSTGGVMRVGLLKISDIATNHFKQGEQLRLSVGIEGNTGGASPRGFIAHDPQNRADDWFTTGNFPTTILKAFIPFKIDI